MLLRTMLLSQITTFLGRKMMGHLSFECRIARDDRVETTSRVPCKRDAVTKYAYTCLSRSNLQPCFNPFLAKVSKHPV